MRKIKEYIEENNLIQKDDRVLVALSGGPDSVCLLHILNDLKHELSISIGAVHVNHMLRGAEAIKDMEYCKEICSSLNIEYFHIDIDIERIAKEQSISIELSARNERYKFFEKVRQENNYNKIAVAHNKNDQAETILMRMMRGTGLDGLTGIKSKRGEYIIRPILCLSRAEIENYCDFNNLNPRIDESNNERIYSRNKVRLDLLPYMKENFNDDIINSINRMVDLLKKDNEYIEKQVSYIYEKYIIYKGEDLIISKKLFLEDEAIVTRVIKKSIIDFSNRYENFEMKHIYEIINFSKKQGSKKIDIINDIVVENCYEDIKFKKKKLKEDKINISELIIKKNELTEVYSFDNYKILFELIDKKNISKFSNNILIKYFDYDNIKNIIKVRTRINGDKIVPLGMKGNKKIKDILIDLKIPKDDRENIPILCFDDEIAWLIGLRVSENFKVSNKTKKVLKIVFEKIGE